MKKRTKIIAGVVTLALIGGGIMLHNNYKTNGNLFDFTSREDRQLAYLKEHEQEIIEFVKAQNPKIESVQIDWEETQWDDSSYPFEEPVIHINLYGGFNHIKDSGWSMQIETEGNKVLLDTMMLFNGLRIGVEYFE